MGLARLQTHLYCGKAIASNIAIPELPVCEAAKATISFTLGRARRQSDGGAWEHHWLSLKGEKLVSYRRDGQYHLLRFPGLADFKISSRASDISCSPVPRIPRDTLRHLLVDQVLPRCLAYRGELMLHASAILLDNKAVLFVGDSRSGKSTLAGTFHQAGYLAVSDDVVLLKERKEGIAVIPSYAGLRLREDSLGFLFYGHATQSMAHYSNKKRVALGTPVARIFRRGILARAAVVLPRADRAWSPEISVSRLSLREAFMEFQEQSFALATPSSDKMTHHLQSLGRIVRRLPAYRLGLPRDFDKLVEVRRSILEHIL